MIGIISFMIILFQNEKLKIVLPFLKTGIVVDGILSEKEKENCISVSNFVEFEPREGEKPPVETEVYLGYNDEGLYIAFVCYDDISQIRKTFFRRDEFPNDDRVWIYLSPFEDLRETYVFTSNPLGRIWDAVTKSDGLNYPQVDYDILVRSQIYEKFWVAEFFIPFFSIKFTEKNEQIWRISLGRERPRKVREIYLWPKISKDNPFFMTESGYLIIPNFPLKRKKTNIFPYFLSFQNGIREEKYKEEKLKYKLGVSGKSKILKNLSFGFTINPDYGEIESDAPQIDVNTIFALWYPEKRPFFYEEGGAILSTKINAIYTRCINDPLYALKFKLTTNLYDFLFLSAYDEHTIYILPFEERSFSFPTNKKSMVNIFRVKGGIFKNGSHIGLLLTQREVLKDEFENGFNRIGGIDLFIRFLKNYAFTYQIIYSVTKEPNDSLIFIGKGIKFGKYTDKFDGEYFKGIAQNLNFNMFFRNFVMDISFEDYSPFFRSDLGYIPRNNFRKINITPIFRGFPNKYWVKEYSLKFTYSSDWNYDGILKSETKKISYNISLIGQTDIIASYSKGKKRLNNILFKDLWENGISINTAFLKYFLFTFYFSQSKEIIYGKVDYGYSRSLGLGIETKTFSNLKSMISSNRYILYYPVAWKTPLYDVWIINLNLAYQFTYHFSTRFILHYYTKTRKLSFYPLIVYEFSPFTVFYLGANINAIKYPYKIEGEKHQIFLKFQYLFKI